MSGIIRSDARAPLASVLACLISCNNRNPLPSSGNPTGQRVREPSLAAERVPAVRFPGIPDRPPLPSGRYATPSRPQDPRRDPKIFRRDPEVENRWPTALSFYRETNTHHRMSLPEYNDSETYHYPVTSPYPGTTPREHWSSCGG